jgi:glycosyltransferase involved in cell wall biosynthesis
MNGVFFADYVAAFAEAGARVGVVYPDLIGLRFFRRGRNIPLRPELHAEIAADQPVVRVRGLHTSLGLPGLQMFRFRGWLRDGLASYRADHGEPDVLHAMCAIPAGWACTHLEDPLARRVVITEHTGPFSLALKPRGAGWYVRTALAKAAAVFSVSQHGRGEMRAAGITRDIEVCGNPVSDPFLKLDVPARRPNGLLRALFVGRLAVEKGIGELAAAATTLGQASKVEWHFVGDGPMKPSITARFVAARMSDRLVLHGECDRPTVARLMTESDFLVLPTYGETFGLAVAEALCTGLPVITSRGTACADFIGEADGLLTDKQNIPSLVAVLRKMADTHARFDRQAIAARARARFSGAAVAENYANTYRGLM